MKIYIGNMPFSMSEDEIRELFAEFGEIESINLITDRETGRPRGFGFVEMPDEAGRKAIGNLNEAEVFGRRLKINEARPRETRASRITDPETGRHRGFGFVEMPNEAGREAIGNLGEKEVFVRTPNFYETAPLENRASRASEAPSKLLSLFIDDSVDSNTVAKIIALFSESYGEELYIVPAERSHKKGPQTPKRPSDRSTRGRW